MNDMMRDCFFAAVETMNFTTAAEKIHITQPAFSRQIAQLEEEVGFPLFLRSKKSGLRITPAGAEFYSGLKKLNEQYEQILTHASSISRGESGKLVIGIIIGSCVNSKTLQAIRRFNEKYPSVEVTLRCYSVSGIIDAVINGECDFIFTVSSAVKNVPNLISENVFEIDNCVYVPNKFITEQKDEYSLYDFKDEPFIMSPEVPVINNLLTSLCNECGFEPNRLMAPDYETKMLWCDMGYGIAINNEDHYVKNSPMVTMLKIKELKAESYDIVWNKDNYNPGIALFYSMFTDVE